MQSNSFFMSIILAIFAAQSFAQVPSGFKYQAVIRDSTGGTINNQNVSLKLSILSDTLPETIAYSETHSNPTNGFGLINLTIGEGSVLSGVFSEIDWGNAQHFLKIEFDASGGTNYQLMGISPFLSVPYTFLANEVMNFGVKGQNLNLGVLTGNSNNTSDGNTFIGYGAGKDNQLGKANTFIGRNTGRSNTNGERNVLLGSSAGYHNTTGYDNVFLGTNSGALNNTGSHNIFIGSNTGYNNTTGLYNTFVGKTAGYLNTTANNNTFIGFSAGRHTTVGAKNTFLGNYAGYTNTVGFSNTYLGINAGKSGTNASRNTYIGEDAGSNNINGSYNVFIGYQAGMDVLDSNKLYIANGADTAQNLIVGDFNTGEITVKGMIESKSGGVKFPDGTIQNTAATTATNTFQGALMKITTDRTLQDDIPYFAEFDQEVYDIGNIWNPTYPTRLYVPQGATFVRLNGNAWFRHQSGRERIIALWKNGARSDIRVATNNVGSGNYERMLINSPVLPVQDGDYFEFYIYQNSGSQVAVGDIWFSLEVVK